MKVKLLGHSAFLITADDGTKIITDPYEPGGYGGAIGYGKIKEAADIVTLSHDHADHAHVQDLAGNPQTVKETGAKTVKGIKFTGVAAYHDEKQGAERGPNTIITMEVNGVKICHVGDLGHDLSKDQIQEIGQVDVLLAPVGGMFTIDAEGAMRLCQALKPKVLIPMHFKTDKCGFPLANVDDFLKGKEGVTRANSSETTFTAASLPAPTKIIVLDHAL